MYASNYNDIAKRHEKSEFLKAVEKDLEFGDVIDQELLSERLFLLRLDRMAC